MTSEQLPKDERALWLLASDDDGDEMDEWEEYWIAIDHEEEEGIWLVLEKLS